MTARPPARPPEPTRCQKCHHMSAAIVCPLCQTPRVPFDKPAREVKLLTDAQYSGLISALNEALEYFEQREDASTDSGEWQGNEEMHLASLLRDALAKAPACP